MSRRLAALGLGLALAACHDATDHEKQRVIGRIDPVHTSVPVIVAPAEAEAHEAFTVLVNTVGSSDCTKPDGGEVVEQGDVVRIVPYDIVPIPGHTDVCQDDNAFHEHRLQVVRDQAGVATLRVVGISAASRTDRLDSVEVAVTVNP